MIACSLTLFAAFPALFKLANSTQSWPALKKKAKLITWAVGEFRSDHGGRQIQKNTRS
jgi:hypothetical protein